MKATTETYTSLYEKAQRLDDTAKELESNGHTETAKGFRNDAFALREKAEIAKREYWAAYRKERQGESETQPNPDVKVTEITPFHFALATDTARVDVAWKQAQGEWRISYDSATYTTTQSKAVAMETAKGLVVNLGHIDWVEQPNGDKATTNTYLQNGNVLYAEVMLNGNGKYEFALVVETKDGNPVDKVAGVSLVGSQGKADYAKERTALRKAELALLREIETQGVYNPDDESNPVTAAVASYDGNDESETQPATPTNPETPQKANQGEPTATVTVPLETAKQLLDYLTLYAGFQRQPPSAFVAIQEFTDAIADTLAETETNPDDVFAFGVIFGDTVTFSPTNKRVAVYSQQHGSCLGFIYLNGTTWFTDESLNLSLGLVKSLESEHLPVMKLKVRETARRK